MDIDINQQWAALHDAQEQAKQDYYDACNPVSARFRAIYGQGGENPTAAQLINFSKTLDKYQEIQKEVAIFIKKNT